MGSTIHLALVGCGNAGKIHAAAITGIGRLAAVCDIVKDKADQVSKNYNATPYYDFNTMLDAENKIDIVVVCSPSELHAEHSIKALQKNIHVLCENPLCIEETAGWTMRDTAHFFRRKLYIVPEKTTDYNTIYNSLSAALQGKDNSLKTAADILRINSQLLSLNKSS